MWLIADLVYLLLLIAVSPWLLWRAIFRGKYRRHVLERFGSVPRRSADAKPLIWIHAVSVGEVVATQPLVRALEAAWPQYEIGISAGTETGRATAARLYPDRPTFQFPLDFSFAVARSLSRLKPAVVLLMELEVWPNFMRAAAWRKVPVCVVNGRMTDHSGKGYARFRWLIGGMFRRLSAVFTQTPHDSENFAAAGVPTDRIQVVGTVKYDALALDADAVREQRDEWRAKLGVQSPDGLVLVAGSTHPPEHEPVIRAWRTLRAEGRKVRLVLVPRHPEKPDPWRFIEQQKLRMVRQSELVDGKAPHDDAIIVGDVMGTLASLYAAADFAFIGKSLLPAESGGGQNPLEPAALGVPTIFGPSMRNFADPADDLLARDAAIRVADETALTAAFRELANSPTRRAEMGARARAAVDAGRGAAARTVEALGEWLGDAPTGSA